MPTIPSSPGLPERAALDDSGLHLALLNIGPQELREPFLHETVHRLRGPQFVAHVPRSDLDRGVPAAFEPAGLIFHVARCGSTMVAQALKQQGHLVVYSEPQAVNELLLSPGARSRAERVAALRFLGAFFSRHAGRPYVLKLSSWNTLFCDLIAEAFPRTPWALCLRDPLEVCVSLLDSRPSWLRADRTALFSTVAGLGPMAQVSEEERAARFFAAFCAGAGRLDRSQGMLLPYESLPDAIWTRLLPHFRLSMTDEARLGMEGVARVYSKSLPGQESVGFVPDGERKRASASGELRRVVDQIARLPYERLTASASTLG